MAFNRVESGFLLDGTPDRLDVRDLLYEPRLAPLADKLDPPIDLQVLDQGQDGASGFGLAANINFLRQRQGIDQRVSGSMLRDMARRFDEWEGEAYDGSSCRGAIKGWYNMGVCTERSWPSSETSLTVERAKEARECMCGAYYRVQPEIAHVHAALSEVGVMYCSAQVHRGWNRLASYDNAGVFNRMIHWRPNYRYDGCHAFAVVGYNEDGLWVVNSWGQDWGASGVALWTYSDWRRNVSDMWVVQIGLPPNIDRVAKAATDEAGGDSTVRNAGPRRGEIAGHFVHISEGKFFDRGRYWSDPSDVEATSDLLRWTDMYDHVLLYAHGGLSSPPVSANHVAATTEVFKQNRIYPYHIIYDRGLMEGLKHIILSKRFAVNSRVGDLSDWSDLLLEEMLHHPGRALWREMKREMEIAFGERQAGTQALEALVDAVRADGAKPKKIHLAGHSTGAILQAHLLRALGKVRPDISVESVSLFAPATSVALFESHYLPLLSGDNAMIKKLVIYNLSDQLELDDNVARVYQKSLLYLVSNSFEETRECPILGMEAFQDCLTQLPRRVNVIHSNGRSGRVRSTSHGRFDSDPHALNDMLRTILGASPGRAFTRWEVGR